MTCFVCIEWWLLWYDSEIRRVFSLSLTKTLKQNVMDWQNEEMKLVFKLRQRVSICVIWIWDCAYVYIVQYIANSVKVCNVYLGVLLSWDPPIERLTALMWLHSFGDWARRGCTMWAHQVRPSLATLLQSQLHVLWYQILRIWNCGISAQDIRRNSDLPVLELAASFSLWDLGWQESYCHSTTSLETLNTEHQGWKGPACIDVMLACLYSWEFWVRSDSLSHWWFLLDLLNHYLHLQWLSNKSHPG